MNITFENADKVNGLMTVTVEEADYQESVEKALKKTLPERHHDLIPLNMQAVEEGSKIIAQQ